MFRGLFDQTVDAKGRVSIPARVREALAGQDEERLIVTTHFAKPCLVVQTLAAWRAFEAKVAALPQFNPSVQSLKRLYVAGATECQVDKQGRILIPPMLREHARLDREVVWAGLVTELEIWSKDEWRKDQEANRDRGAELMAEVANLGL